MITELTNYISELSKQFPLKEFVQPAEGIHILLEVKDEQVKFYKLELYQPVKGKEDDYSDYIRQECLPRELHMHYINPNKAISDKKIHSASPFGFMVKKQSLENKTWMTTWKLNITKYFSESMRKCKIEITENQKNIFEKFTAYCNENLLTELRNLKDYKDLKSKNYIIVYLKNFAPEQYEQAYNYYLENNLFNKPKYTLKNKIQNEYYGASDFYNGFNLKKPFLIHKTAPFDINFRISQSVSRWLFIFNQYRQTGKAIKTNPLLVFLDKKELNNEVIGVIKQEGNQISFHHLIQTIFEKTHEDLGNYYLFYFLGGDLKDVDFVSCFNFDLDITIRKVIPTTNPKDDEKIKDIFKFEKVIVKEIFNNQLVKRKDERYLFRYFDEIEKNLKYITDTEWQLVMRYRKAFYDFIYKSRRQALTSTALYDIMWKGILDDLRHTEIQNKFRLEQRINHKLNLWFSLWDFFKSTKNQNNLDMANKITNHQDRLRTVRDNANEHIQTDDEFAFTAGQIIYYLLTKSKSSNLTHAALEPFLQKTGAGELKKAIGNTFNAYKHEIDFGQGRFEKFCSEIMDYELNGTLKELMPFLLAGYFSTSLIYEPSQNK